MRARPLPVCSTSVPGGRPAARGLETVRNYPVDSTFSFQAKFRLTIESRAWF